MCKVHIFRVIYICGWGGTERGPKRGLWTANNYIHFRMEDDRHLCLCQAQSQKESFCQSLPWLLQFWENITLDCCSHFHKYGLAQYGGQHCAELGSSELQIGLSVQSTFVKGGLSALGVLKTTPQNSEGFNDESSWFGLCLSCRNCRDVEVTFSDTDSTGGSIAGRRISCFWLLSWFSNAPFPSGTITWEQPLSLTDLTCSP